MITETFFYIFFILGILMSLVGTLEDNKGLFRAGIVVFLCSVSLYMMKTLP
jgi:hypothetical protein